MSQLIDSMLALSRITRGELSRQPVNLSALAAEIIEDLRAAQPDRPMDVRIEEGLTTLGDPRLLRALLENLLSNAWKFTSKVERASIEFGITRTDEGSAYCVKDNGAGFDMRYQDKLFGAFQRLHSEQDFPGTGIGLASAQRIVRRHGGRIWAESALDQGARFYFAI
jgi:signal transduction histidine kinase